MGLDTPPLFEMHQQLVKSDDWYTTADVFETLGLIFDVDVAAPPGGVPWIPALTYFTVADNGLAQPWTGRVWMNPPYSNPMPWVRRFIEHGHGVTCLPFSKAHWFEELWNSDAAIVHRGVIGSAFSRKGKIQQMNFPILYAALGDDCKTALARLGKVR